MLKLLFVVSLLIVVATAGPSYSDFLVEGIDNEEGFAPYSFSDDLFVLFVIFVIFGLFCFIPRQISGSTLFRLRSDFRVSKEETFKDIIDKKIDENVEDFKRETKTFVSIFGFYLAVTLIKFAYHFFMD